MPDQGIGGQGLYDIPVYSPMSPEQSQSYVGWSTFKIAWVPLGSTLGDNDPLFSGLVSEL